MHVITVVFFTRGWGSADFFLFINGKRRQLKGIDKLTEKSSTYLLIVVFCSQEGMRLILLVFFYLWQKDTAQGHAETRQNNQILAAPEMHIS